MPNGHNEQWNGAGGVSAGHFAHSRRRIKNSEMTLDTIAGSLLRIFVMEKLDASLGQLSRRVTDLESRAAAGQCSSIQSMVPEASC